MFNRVLVIGETCKDIFCYGKCDRLCPEAPAPVFNPIEEVENPGMAMNVQKNILSLGIACDIITNKNWREIVKTRYIHKNTNQMFIRIDKGDDKITRCKVGDINFEGYDAIIISDYNKGFLSENDIDEIASKHNYVFLDTKRKLGDWCNKVNFIKINNYEHEKTKHLLTDELKKKLIITLGHEGCLFREKIFSVEEVEIKDVTGAGDTFMAGLVAEYIKTKNIEKAIIFANQCATKVVQKRGVNIV